MNTRHVISAEANLGEAQVKPHGGGRSQNYMPPEAKDAINKAQQASEKEAGSASAEYPVAKQLLKVLHDS